MHMASFFIFYSFYMNDDPTKDLFFFSLADTKPHMDLMSSEADSNDGRSSG
jgi:hypothetical protein